MARIDADTLDMFTATLRSVLGGSGDVTGALVDAGWRDVLAEDDEAIVPVQFRLQGGLLARSAALDDVVRLAAGTGGPVVHPRPGRSTAIAADGTVDGLAFAPVDGLDAVAVRGLDPDLGLVRVTGRAPEGLVDGGAATYAARRAIAAEVLGVASTMLDTATEHAKSRMQYGQPIGVFQAVKFRLADALVAIQAAEVVLEEAWGDEADVVATAAKCLAGRAFRLAAENCLQVLGAIGFTWEHDLHRFTRRGLVLDVLYGSTEELRRELGTALIGRGSAPVSGRSDVRAASLGPSPSINRGRRERTRCGWELGATLATMGSDSRDERWCVWGLHGSTDGRTRGRGRRASTCTVA